VSTHMALESDGEPRGLRPTLKSPFRELAVQFLNLTFLEVHFLLSSTAAAAAVLQRCVEVRINSLLTW
jgi:hypothetical protein